MRSAHSGGGYSENPTVSMPLSFMYCEDEGKDRTFDPELPASTIYCLCLCVPCFPSQAERKGRHSKAMKAWLWSVIHVWQVLRGPQQHSGAFGIMTGPQVCDANEAPEAVSIFQHSKHHVPESKESSWAHCSLSVHMVKLIPLLILFYSHLTTGIWKSTWPLSTIAPIFLQTDANAWAIIEYLNLHYTPPKNPLTTCAFIMPVHKTAELLLAWILSKHNCIPI